MQSLDAQESGATAEPSDTARLRELRGLLQAIASGGDLQVALDRIARWVERASPGAICSVLLIGEDARVHHGAAPSLPEAFTSKLDGEPIGPQAGSCGTAAYLGKPIIVDDIATDPLWATYRDLALSFGLQACWSHPVFGADGRVIATFAIYRTAPGRPSDDEWQMVVDAALLAGLVIERARADNRRQLQERTLASIVDHASDQIIRLDADGRLLFLNAAALRASGRQVADFTAAPFADAGYPPELIEAWREGCRIAAETGTPHRFDYRVPRDDGDRWYETTIAPEMDEDGKVTSFVAVARDVTFRREAEARLRASEQRLHLILNTTEQSIALLDTEGRLIDVGERAEATTGLPRTRILGMRFWELPSFAEFPDAQAALRDAIERAARGEQVRGELLWRPSGGSVRLGVYSVKPIRGADGRVEQLILEEGDITEKRELEERVRQSEKMESLGRLAGGIAHDFNNVLAAIHGYGELLMVDLPRHSEMADNVQQLLKASRRARDLVRQILTFSRKADVSRAPIDLRVVVADAVRLLRAGLPATVELRERSAERPVIVLGDASQISQVLLNLGANAEYAIRAIGHGTLEISLENTILDDTRAASLGLEPGTYAHLVVRDSGAGIAADAVAKVFEPFFTTKPVGEGTGMGLAVVHGIVSAHGGVVRVTSQPGTGTTFDVYIPSVDATASVEANHTPSEAMGSGRVLVVDDEDAIVSMLERLLPRRGYTATCFTSPAAALDHFRRNPDAFDVLITDRTMPGMTGDALVAAVHAIRPRLPVVMCSGHGHDSAAEPAGASAGLVQHVGKPFELSDLLHAVERALALAREELPSA